jgi:hypothetical protein
LPVSAEGFDGRFAPGDPQTCDAAICNPPLPG